MKAHSASTSFVIIFSLLQITDYAHAAIPPYECYSNMSMGEYERFVQTLKTFIARNNSGDGMEISRFGPEQQVFRHAEERLKAVHVDLKVSQNKSGDIINVDASASTTPSKKVQYNWFSHGENGFQHNDSSNPKNTVKPFGANKHTILTFGITDPICNSSGKAGIKIESK